MRDDKNLLGPTVKKAREEKGITQAELSDELSISTRYLQSIENENQIPSYAVLQRLLAYLTLSADSVMMPVTNDSPETKKLHYLIDHMCTPEDILVLLATAEAMLKNHPK